jgi:predicted  nucleic acid-binding Zn-ribbon protein
VNLGFRLFRLQQVDTHLDDVAKRLAEIERKLADDDVVREARAAIEAQGSAIDATRKEISQADSEVKAAQLKLKENQDALYGGKVKNPKELQDLQLEAENLTRHLKEHEDAELDKMMQLEEQQAGLQQAQADLEAVLAQRGVDQRILGREQAELQTEKERLQEEREPALHGISPEALSVYEGLRKNKGGLAVAKAAGKECSGCGAELSAALAQAARSPNELARCDTCKRILYAS